MNVPEYPKIQTLWKRESEKPCRIIEGDYATPELAALATAPIWTLTEKVDGTNIRVEWDPKERSDEPWLAFHGRTANSNIPAKLVNRLAVLFSADRLAEVFGDEPEADRAVLYGEGYGAGIQKAGASYNVDPAYENDFVLFDVWCGGLWLKRDAVEDIAEKLNIRAVPIVEEDATLGWMNRYAEEGLPSAWGDFTAEGLVARPEPELQDRRGKRIITKLKTKDFA